MSKVCTKCGVSKALSNFSKSGVGKLRADCKDCGKSKTANFSDLVLVKTCTVCKVEKDIKQFQRAGAHRRGECKSCTSIKEQKRREKRNSDPAKLAKHKADHLAYQRKNKHVFARAASKWRSNNPETSKARSAEYRKNNQEYESQRHKKYYDENKPKIMEYRDKNREKIRQTIRTYYANNPSYRIGLRCRGRIRELLGSGKGHQKLLGCDREFFKDWFEFQFDWDSNLDMNFSNHGTWHIDHVLPCFVFDLTDEHDKNTCFHWTNLSPVIAKTNHEKSRTIVLTSIMKQNYKIMAFCKLKNIPPPMLYIKPYLHKTRVIFHMFDSSDTNQKCETPQLRELPKDSTTNLVLETE